MTNYRGNRPQGTHGRQITNTTRPLRTFYRGTDLYLRIPRNTTINGIVPQSNEAGPLPDFTIVEIGTVAVLLWRTPQSLYKCGTLGKEQKQKARKDKAVKPTKLPSASVDQKPPGQDLPQGEQRDGGDQDDDLFEGEIPESLQPSQETPSPPPDITNAAVEPTNIGTILDPSTDSEEAEVPNAFTVSPDRFSESSDNNTQTAQSISNQAQIHEDPSAPGTSIRKNNEINQTRPSADPASENSNNVHRRDSLDDILAPVSLGRDPSPPARQLSDLPLPTHHRGVAINTYNPILHRQRVAFVDSMFLAEERTPHYRIPGMDDHYPRHRIDPGVIPLYDMDVHLAIAAVWAETYQRRDVAMCTSLNATLLALPERQENLLNGTEESFHGSKKRFLLPITILPQGEETVGHHILCLAEEITRSDIRPEVSLEFWDSFRDPRYMQRGFEQARRTIERSFFFAHCLRDYRERRRHRCSRQCGLECGVHVILNAWAWLLDLQIRAQDPQRNHSRVTFPESFYRQARRVINLTLGGRMDEQGIRDFLIAYGYVEDDGSAARGTRGFTIHYCTDQVMDHLMGSIP